MAEVYATTAYAASRTNYARTSLASDNVFSDDSGALQIAETSGTVSGGYTAVLQSGCGGLTAQQHPHHQAHPGRQQIAGHGAVFLLREAALLLFSLGPVAVALDHDQGVGQVGRSASAPAAPGPLAAEATR